MTCAICGLRKPRRFCPGVNGNICSICCGTGREETIDCPLQCEYLQEAHQHEHLDPVDPETIPNSDIELRESFIRENEPLLAFLGSAVVDAFGKSPAMTDYDVREGLESLVRTYRAQQSGLYYEAVPVNAFAASVFESIQARVAVIRKIEAESGDTPTLSDAIVFGVIAFLQRLEYMHNNGRKRSRAFLDLLATLYVAFPGEAEPVAEEPRLIL